MTKDSKDYKTHPGRETLGLKNSWELDGGFMCSGSDLLPDKKMKTKKLGLQQILAASSQPATDQRDNIGKSEKDLSWA